MPLHEVGPRSARTETRAEVSGQPNHCKRSDRERFREAFSMTAGQVDSALTLADATQLARALDPYGFVNQTVTFRCPTCDRKQAAAVSRWRWRCEACDQHGSWIALRHLVALDVEACCRLGEIVHGIEVGRSARDVA